MLVYTHYGCVGIPQDRCRDLVIKIGDSDESKMKMLTHSTFMRSPLFAVLMSVEHKVGIKYFNTCVVVNFLVCMSNPTPKACEKLLFGKFCPENA